VNDPAIRSRRLARLASISLGLTGFAIFMYGLLEFSFLWLLLGGLLSLGSILLSHHLKVQVDLANQMLGIRSSQPSDAVTLDQVFPQNPRLRSAGAWCAFLGAACLLDLAGTSCSTPIPLLQRMPVVGLAVLGAFFVVSAFLGWCERRLAALPPDNRPHLARFGALVLGTACVLVFAAKVFVTTPALHSICR
jgi:hypothetical protein